MKDCKTVVVKLGTSTLTRGSKHLNKAHMLEIVRAVAALKSQGHKVLLVSSGAVAAGREQLNDPKLPALLSSKQMLASVGQSKLMELYERFFSIYNIHIGQILLTRADLENRERFLNAKDTLSALLEHDIIPVINENDAVSTMEIKVGDNDNMAALTGILCSADMVILLTDQKGLYDSDPRENKDAKLIREVTEINEDIIKVAGGSGTTLGTGGMSTKVKAARVATMAGITLVVASGDDPQIIADIVSEKAEATYFRPQLSKIQSRKIWIQAATKTSGSVVIDDGAVQALMQDGSSLLPSGIIKVCGEFERGSCISVTDSKGIALAIGICRYNSDEIDIIKGLKSHDIEEALGFSHGAVVIHRDDLCIES